LRHLNKHFKYLWLIENIQWINIKARTVNEQIFYPYLAFSIHKESLSFHIVLALHLEQQIQVIF